MLFNTLLTSAFLATGLSQLAAAQTTGRGTQVPTNTRVSTPTATAACGQVARRVTGAGARVGQAVEVDPVVAEACLKSVPIDKAENAAFLKELNIYIGWQSNLAWLAKPPAGYKIERVDTVKTLREIASSLEKDEYTNEWDFQLDVTLALAQARDGHLSFVADILSVFTFLRLGPDGDILSLASASVDGKALPEIYLANELNEGVRNPSPITHINNRTASDYLTEWGNSESYADADARYNSLLSQQHTALINGGIGGFSGGIIPDGARTYLTFKNGTVVSYPNVARTRKDFSRVTDGRTFYRYLLNQGPPTLEERKARRAIEKRKESKAGAKEERRQLVSTRITATGRPTATAIATPTSTSTGIPAFPKPEFNFPNYLLSGYYLREPGYEDVAVLSVPTFMVIVPRINDPVTRWQDLVQKFLRDSVAAGKKRLIIDLRGNGGGLRSLGFDLFKQLFPDKDPYLMEHFRATPALNSLGLAIDNVIKTYDYNQAVSDLRKYEEEQDDPNPSTRTLAELNDKLVTWALPFNWKVPLNKDGKAFKSWTDYFGPSNVNGDQLTSLFRSDFTNFFSDDLDLDVSGYRTRASMLSPQPFLPENIVLLQDGSCASTCAIFTELMKTKGAVQQIVVGGTPKTGPMQSVAGTKGTQLLPWSTIQAIAAGAAEVIRNNKLNIDIKPLTDLITANRPMMRVNWLSSSQEQAGINLRDDVRIGDKSQTPLEFVYEAADCRLFYTLGMYSDVTNLWTATADAKWKNYQGCVEKSTKDPSSLGGGYKSPNANAASSVKAAGMSLLAAAFMTIFMMAM